MTAAGEAHSLFLTDLGEIYSCGFNEFGELGIGEIASINHGKQNNDQEEVSGNP
jgi:alpha-tubulin suppressor-like RCC1 family protein